MKHLSKEEMATNYTEMLTENCALNNDQIARIKKINLDYVTRMSDNPKENAEEYDQDYDVELKKVLNEEQYGK